LTTQIANAVFVANTVATETSRAQSAEGLLAPKASPTFTGVPAAPTAALATNTTQLATTAFVIANAGVGNVTSVFTRSGAITSAPGDYNATQIPNVVVTVTQSATPAIDTDNGNYFSITGLAQAITSMTTGLTGTPVHGQEIIIEYTDNATARAITHGASFASTSLTLSTTTVVGQVLREKFTWNAVNSTWDLIEVSGGVTIFKGQLAIANQLIFQSDNGSLTINPNQQSGTYGTNYLDYLIQATSGSWTLTLNGNQSGQVIWVVNTGSGTITVTCAGGTNYGSASIATHTSAKYWGDGTNFWPM
jgi:hypothetical protein